MRCTPKIYPTPAFSEVRCADEVPLEVPETQIQVLASPLLNYRGVRTEFLDPGFEASRSHLGNRTDCVRSLNHSSPSRLQRSIRSAACFAGMSLSHW